MINFIQNLLPEGWQILITPVILFIVVIVIFLLLFFIFKLVIRASSKNKEVVEVSRNKSAIYFLIGFIAIVVFLWLVIFPALGCFVPFSDSC